MTSIGSSSGLVILGMVSDITGNTTLPQMDNQEHAKTVQAPLKLMELTRMVMQLQTTNIVLAFAKENKLIAFSFSIGSLFILDSLTKATLTRRVIGGKWSWIAMTGLDSTL